LKVEEKIKNSSDFKKLEVTNFRTKAAQELRDAHLAKDCVNFLTQAFRYRGKANYRDSIYLSYGDNHSDDINLFTDDLYQVAKVFIRMSSFYFQRRIEAGIWELFVDDIRKNSRLSHDTNVLEI
jgi:hypothetical protein